MAPREYKSFKFFYYCSHSKHMTSKSEIGKIGEDLAYEYLINKGYKILERNYWRKWGELDIIAKDPANTLVFVEVKTLRQTQCEQSFDQAQDKCGNSAIHGEQCRTIAELKPEDNLTAAKLKKLQRTAQLFTGKHSELVNDIKGWRIDLLAIEVRGDKTSVKHYENI